MIYFKSDNIVSSLGITTHENYEAIKNGDVGIQIHNISDLYNEPFIASMIDYNDVDFRFNHILKEFGNTNTYTKLEKMILVSVYDALSRTHVDIKSPQTGIIISTTKGNIDLLDSSISKDYENDRVKLWKLGEIISGFFSNPNPPIVVSNACISGVMAINLGAQLLENRKYRNVVVIGGDIVSRFVLSGFKSFLSLSPEPCKPFDAERNGLSLGEAAATIILGLDSEGSSLGFKGGGSANDANHISGPSRTGEGSFLAIKRAMIEADIKEAEIDHISAHGTATPYNDEMESIAIDRHGLNHAAVNSMKGYLGHTLGAAGVVETSILLEEMRRGEILKSAGFNKIGVSKDINIATDNTRQNLNNCLKMASGFGGSNAALIISKLERYDQ